MGKPTRDQLDAAHDAFQDVYDGDNHRAALDAAVAAAIASLAPAAVTVSPMERELKLARQLLEMYGVSDDRMRGNVATGIGVLVTRMDKQVAALTAQCEADKRDAARYRWWRENIEQINDDDDGIVGVAFANQIDVRELRSSAEYFDMIADSAITAGNGEGV